MKRDRLARQSKPKADRSGALCSTTRRCRRVLPLVALVLWMAVPAIPPARSQTDRTGLKIVVIDPGHGGPDNGAIGPRGTREKQVVLALARAVQHAAVERFRVLLTRSDDYGMPLHERSAAANRERADAFVSLHTGGSLNKRVEGIDIFYAGSLPAGKDHTANGQTATPWRHLQAAHREASQRLARLLELHLNTADISDRIRLDPAPLTVLEGVATAAVLLEVGYLTHAAGESRLTDAAQLETLAKAVADALDDFLAGQTPFTSTDLRE